MMAASTLGIALREYREEAGKTIFDVAVEAGIEQNYLSRIERDTVRGLYRPSRDLVIRLGMAIGLGIDGVDELLLDAGYAPLWDPRKKVST